MVTAGKATRLKPLARSFEELVTHLRMAEGARVLVVTVRDRDLESALVDALRDRLGAEITVLEFRFTPEHLSLPRHLQSLTLPPGRAVLFARGLDELAPEERRNALQAMNLGREHIRWTGLPLVLWLRPEIVNELLVHAPDIWVVCSGTFTFELPPDQIVRGEAVATLRLAAAKGLADLRRRYLDWLTAAHGWLDLRGLLQGRNMLAATLEDIFVEPELIHRPPADRGLPPELLEGRPSTPAEGEEVPTLESIPAEVAAVRWGERAPAEERLSLAQALTGRAGNPPHLVILGDPGSGKSTLLRYLALRAAGKTGPVGWVGNPPMAGNPPLPILLPLSAYAVARAREPDLTLADYLPRYWVEQGLPDFSPLFTRALRRGRALVLLDGLDEVLHAGERVEVVRQVRALVAAYPDNCFIVTSRIAGYHSAPLGGDFTELTIAPFGPEEVHEFARRWSRACEAARAWTPDAKARAAARAEDLANAVNSHPGIRRLATNPLLLTILALIHYQGTRLPQRRVELYRLCVQALAETWNLARSLTGRPIDVWLGHEPLDERRVVGILAPVAFWVHAEVPGGLVEWTALRERIARYLAEHEGHPREEALRLADDFLDLMREQSGLLVERGPDLYGFMHLTFQEYLAARYLAAQADPFALLRPHLHDPHWREVVLLTAGVLGLFSEVHATRFVQQIWEAGSPYNDLLQWDLLLAARCLADDVPVRPDLRDRLLAALFDLWRTTPYEKLQQETTAILAAMGETTYGRLVVARLLDALQDKDAEVRRRAARALGELGRTDEMVVEALLGALRDESGWVRAWAAAALAALGRRDRAVSDT